MDVTLGYIEKRGREEGEKHGLNLAAKLYRLLADGSRMNGTTL